MLVGLAGWAFFLFAQNYAFTFVSRARNSASLKAHFKASIFSNGIWIVSQMIMLGPMIDNITGKHGRGTQVLSALIYTVATVTGSLVSHYIAKKTEKGKTAVGASDLYAQITKADWAAIRLLAANADERSTKLGEDFVRVRGLAEQAYDLSLGIIPDSGISAQKFDGAIVTPGLESAKA